MQRTRAVRHAAGIALLVVGLCAAPPARGAGGKDEITQPKHPGPRVITVAADSAATQPLPRVSQRLPRLSRRLPRLAEGLPRLRGELPRLDSRLPQLARRLPRLEGPPVQRLRGVRSKARARRHAGR